MIKFHIDGSSKWEYAINDDHVKMKLDGRPATVVKPLCGLKYWINALKALLGLDYDVYQVERWGDGV